MILDIPPQTIELISSVALKQGQSVESFILMSAYEKALQFSQSNNQSQLVTEFFANTKPLDIFKDIDPVNYQRQVRDELTTYLK